MEVEHTVNQPDGLIEVSTKNRPFELILGPCYSDSVDGLVVKKLDKGHALIIRTTDDHLTQRPKLVNRHDETRDLVIIKPGAVKTVILRYSTSGNVWTVSNP